MDMKIGLQLYSVRDQMEKDFIGTLEKVSAMGYDGVEFAGYGGFSAEDLKEHLDRLNLKCCGSHVPIEQIRDNTLDVIKYMKTLQAKYVVCPWYAVKDENSLNELIKILNEKSKIFNEEGLILCYHNHNHEFIKINDEYALDILYKSTDENYLKAQIDTYWVKYAGEDPINYLLKYKGRIPTIHFKDMLDEKSKECSIVGEGIIPFQKIHELREELGCEWYIIEDEGEENTLDRVSKGVKNIKKLID